MYHVVRAAFSTIFKGGFAVLFASGLIPIAGPGTYVFVLCCTRSASLWALNPLESEPLTV